MHELSLVMNVLKMADDEMTRHHAGRVEKVCMEIGELSGVEMDAFRFAWEHATNGTVLEGAALEVTRTPGFASCQICTHQFPVENLYTACPVCGAYDVEIKKGKALKVQSLTLFNE